MNQQLQAVHHPDNALIKPATATEIKKQVDLIQDVMRKVMIMDTHYGTIPGTPKPALYKAGAEKLCLTFRLAASFDVQQRDLPDGHREYTVNCRLTDRATGNLVGEGIGVCTTMESKYRYRWDNTGAAVPKEYWDTKDTSLLGGGVARKVSGDWLIFFRVEHDNPADYYNTVAKMAKKRAHVDATITSTAASDIFDQDTDDPDGIPTVDGSGKPAPKPSGGKRKQPQAAAQQSGAITEAQGRLLSVKLRDSGKSEQELLDRYGIKAPEELPKAKMNEALQWLQEKEK